MIHRVDRWFFLLLQFIYNLDFSNSLSFPLRPIKTVLRGTNFDNLIDVVVCGSTIHHSSSEATTLLIITIFTPAFFPVFCWVKIESDVISANWLIWLSDTVISYSVCYGIISKFTAINSRNTHLDELIVL